MIRNRAQLKKGRRILRSAYYLYRKKGKRLTPDQRVALEKQLADLDRALMDRAVDRVVNLSGQLEKDLPHLFHKTTFDYCRDVLIAIVFAVIAATLIRQMWFEPMEIPSGSMRPTYQELDRLLVSKTTFGINIPAMPGHLYLDPNLVKRTGVFIFTTEHMDIPDQNTRYFYIFPGKKRFIKRCMGKPGDRLYFYGGKVYGIDQEGASLPVYQQAPWMEAIETVPVITFEGKVTTSTENAKGIFTPVFYHQMNQTLARLSVTGQGEVRGELYNGHAWVPDDPVSTKPGIHTYGDFWGMRNYAMARLLSREQVDELSEEKLLWGKGELYLELQHDPTLSYPRPIIQRDQLGRLRPFLVPFVSLIPCQQTQLNALMDHMTTSRFVVEDGYARLEREAKQIHLFAPLFPQVPDGRYEFSRGQGYRVGWGGILESLPADHPLYSRKAQNVQRLFNLGMEMNLLYAPHARDQLFRPARYAYFRNGALFIMGGELLNGSEPLLQTFIQREQARAAQASPHQPYLPFIDHGPPLKENGEVDAEFLRIFGLRISEAAYLALGDNYADSSDSRLFGFVPQANLRGAPAFLLWPPGPRWGFLNANPYPWFSPFTLLIWCVIVVVIVAAYLIGWARERRPIFIPRKPKE